MPLVARLPTGDWCLLGEGDAVEFYRVDEAEAERLAEGAPFDPQGRAPDAFAPGRAEPESG